MNLLSWILLTTIVMSLWACGTSSDTVREELTGKQSAKDLIGTWQYMDSDKNGELVPVLAWPLSESTATKKLRWSHFSPKIKISI